MSECSNSSSMTGSTKTGLLQPQEDSLSLLARTSPFEGSATPDNNSSARRCRRHQLHRKMTPVPPAVQPIQLTPLWEHVVRTRRFPSEVDTRSTFIEISERLRDPEWEVRQHALRVLMDVLPTLNAEIVDQVMQPVVPELVNNLGHAAPAVRKGALDTLRVYLVHSRDREEMMKNILRDGLNRSDSHDAFQTNVTAGVILSAPCLLFPSSSSPRPTASVLKDITIALASRLSQTTHQESLLRSLMKIRDLIGGDEFDRYIENYDEKLKRSLEVLCKVYDVKPGKRNRAKAISLKDGGLDKDEEKDRWESDSDTSGIAEEEDEENEEEEEEDDDDDAVSSGIPGRIVLETEIKFDEETAITMTILEEKDRDSEVDETIKNEAATDLEEASSERRKTPRRVHFGGEVVKLRTPDSDDTGSLVTEAPKTRIPLPVSPITRMPGERSSRRPSSQPCSPHLARRRSSRASRSVSSSPKREVHAHNADLSPKKGILARTSERPSEEDQQQRSIGKRRKVAMRERTGAEDVLRGDVTSEELGRAASDQFVEAKKDEERSIRSEPKKSVSLVPEGSNEVEDDQTRLQNAEEAGSKEAIGKNGSPKEKEYGGLPRDPLDVIMGESCVEDEFQNYEFSMRVQERDGAVGAFPDGDKSDAPSKSADSNERKARKKGNAMEVDSSFEIADSIQKDKSVRIKVFASEIDRTSDAEKSDPFPRSEADQDASAIGRLDEIESMKESSTTADKSQEIRPVSEFTGKDQFSTKRVQAPRPITTNSYVERTKVVDRNILKYGDIQRSSRRDDPVNERAMGNGSLTCSSSESEGKVQEPSWEELGLVDQEVLDDLHNKDDWRARVRGLERVASALRTSSALIAIESRLGSLLHAVLGGERSCRVAAAGLSVAKVIVAGVSEDALKRRLSQLAWGLARQGGPHAAQLARIAMLRLRPALFLEQLLQAQCFGARNAKTRENALQLLIFSLVTFPSTEFKVEAVAHKVATMVGDRRRRVRQAALDALAVLAQIYDSEEVLQAGKRASAGRHDGQAMMSAIRARLARRSLPLVSADGLVVYGLQISPTVQIATGPDVDWIVAGSGSVSPGTGRSRGQIIASTTKLEKGRILRDRNTMTRESPWRNRPNFITHGIGLRSKNEHPVAWQIIPHNQDDSCRDEMQESKGRNRVIHDGEKRNFGLKSEERCLHASSNEKRKNSQTDSVIHRESVRNDSTDNGNVQSIVKENTGYKTESRIPVLFSRDRGLNIRSNECNPDVDNNLQITNVKSRGKTKYDEDGTSNKTNSRDDYIGSYEALYRRRKRLQQDALANATPSHKQGTAGRQEQIYLQNNSQNYEKLTKDERSSKSSDGNSKSYRSNSMEGRPYSLSKNVEPPTSSMFPTPTPIYQGQRRFLESQTFKALSPGSSQLTSVYQDIQNLNQQVISNNEKNVFARSKTDRETKDSSSRNAADAQQVPSNTQTNTQSFLGKRVDSPFRRRLRSLSPSQLYDQRRIVRLASNGIKTSMYNIDKTAVNEDEYNEQNKTYCLSEINNYPTEALNKNDDLYQVADFINSKNLESSSSNASARTDQTDPRQPIDRNIFDEDEQRRVNNSNDDSRSSSSRSQNADKAFDVISQKSNLQERGTGRSYAIPISTKESDGSIESTIASMEDDTSKDWSSDEEIKPRSGIEALSSREEFLLLSTSNSNENSDAVDEADNTKEASRRSATSSLSKERSVTNDSSMPSNEFLQFVYSSSSYQEIRPTSPSQRAVSSTKSETAYSINSSSNDSNNFEISSTLKRNLKEQPISSASEYEEAVEYSNLNEERAISSIFTDKDASFQLRDIERSPVVSPTAGSPRIHTVFRSRSNVSVTNTNDSTKTESNISSHSTGNISLFSKESSPLDLREDRTASTDVSFNKMPMQSESFAKIDDIINNISETNIEPSIFKIGIPTVESVESTKKMTSRVPRSIMRTRSSTSKASTSQQPEKTVIKSQLSIQQCFTQLESKDWESTMKGLKSLSQIAKQHPEYLDSCAAGTIGRLLGRHIRNLRSQVARAACIAAGDIFNTQIKGIDQEIDDIVGPLLHRTADTNRFLRSDSNMALDIMVEHLPPHKIIGVIVHHGASHQNSIVRAATARLLSSIVDRVGPEQAMTLPRDVRDKLLCSGARLVIDGNLDARNHAKKMFRKLIHCEGFQRALTDAVPDTTLRHIDKTLKSL